MTREKTHCPICQSKASYRGLLARCNSTFCNTVVWDSVAVKKTMLESGEDCKKYSPKWVEDILKNAGVPAWVAGQHYVYTIKLCRLLPKTISARKASKMPNKGKGRFYIGMTGLHPFARYLNHLRGYKSSWAVKEMAVALVGFEGPMSYEQAKLQEKEIAEKLRGDGYDIHGGH